MARIVGAACFHLDEHDRAAVDGNDIQLAERRIEAASQNAKTLTLQKLGGRVLAPVAERLLEIAGNSRSRMAKTF